MRGNETFAGDAPEAGRLHEAGMVIVRISYSVRSYAVGDGAAWFPPARFVAGPLIREISTPILPSGYVPLIRRKSSYGVCSALKAPPLAKGRCREATEG